jgi:hypothetical protein
MMLKAGDCIRKLAVTNTDGAIITDKDLINQVGIITKIVYDHKKIDRIWIFYPNRKHKYKTNPSCTAYPESLIKIDKNEYLLESI